MSLDRRRFVRATALAAAAGASVLAGCPDDGDGDDEPAGDDAVGDDSAGDQPADDDPDGDDGDDGDEAASDPAAVDYEDPDGSVRFVHPEDGDEVASPVELEMAAEEFTVEPADEGVRDGHGHLHVLIDVDCVAPGEPIPLEEEGYVHYGEGETTDELELEPGEYEFCLQAGDADHVAYDLTDEISITVSEETGE